MPRREIPLIRGEHYHVYNRGANRQRLYHSADNYVYFLRKTREYLHERPTQRDVKDVEPSLVRPVVILAWCLMPNHFHLLVRLECDDFSVRMKSLAKSYTQAINRAEARTGPLFEGRFQAIHVDDESYLLHLSRYIHLNPSQARLVAQPADWEYSSYRDYVADRQGTLVSPGSILREFPLPCQYREFCESGASGVDLRRYLPDE
jgi:putative transposase